MLKEEEDFFFQKGFSFQPTEFNNRIKRESEPKKQIIPILHPSAYENRHWSGITENYTPYEDLKRILHPD